MTKNDIYQAFKFKSHFSLKRVASVDTWYLQKHKVRLQISKSDLRIIRIIFVLTFFLWLVRNTKTINTVHKTFKWSAATQRKKSFSTIQFDFPQRSCAILTSASLICSSAALKFYQENLDLHIHCFFFVVH